MGTLLTLNSVRFRLHLYTTRPQVHSFTVVYLTAFMIENASQCNCLETEGKPLKPEQEKSIMT